MPDARQNSPEKEESRGRFDLVVTFEEDARAREALMALRSAGFTPEQAILLEPEGRASSDVFALDGWAHVSPEELAADRKLAIAVIITTEVAVGIIAGAVVGWIISLFVHAPQIGPVWVWMLPLGVLGGALGAGVGTWEWRRWGRGEVKHLRHETAIGLRFTGDQPASELQRARAILEQYGGSGIDNA